MLVTDGKDVIFKVVVVVFVVVETRGKTDVIRGLGLNVRLLLPNTSSLFSILGSGGEVIPSKRIPKSSEVVNELLKPPPAELLSAFSTMSETLLRMVDNAFDTHGSAVPPTTAARL